MTKPITWPPAESSCATAKEIYIFIICAYKDKMYLDILTRWAPTISEIEICLA